MKLLRATALAAALVVTVPALPSSAQAAHWHGGWHGGWGGFGLGFAAAAILGSALAAPSYGYYGPYYGYYGPWHHRHWHYGPRWHHWYGWRRWHHWPRHHWYGWRGHRWHHWRHW